MNRYASNHPVLFGLLVTLGWLVLLVVSMGIASSALHRPYGEDTTVTIGRLVGTACILLLVWRLGWLESSGIARLGKWQIWLLAFGGMIYFAGTSLYSFYGKPVFSFSTLIRSPESSTVLVTLFVVSVGEEILFRGLVLHALIRVWGVTTQGIIGSVFVTSLLFAVLHVSQVLTHSVSLSSVSWLILETSAISIWWGGLVVRGRCVWPAVMLHFAVSAIVAIQGLTVPMVEPATAAYRQILWFSLPLGAVGIWLLLRAEPHPNVLDWWGTGRNARNHDDL
jgi:membrane protease YdiL (CAAX protease family)